MHHPRCPVLSSLKVHKTGFPVPAVAGFLCLGLHDDDRSFLACLWRGTTMIHPNPPTKPPPCLLHTDNQIVGKIQNYSCNPRPALWSSSQCLGSERISVGHDGGMLPKKVDVPVKKDMVLCGVSTYGVTPWTLNDLGLHAKSPECRKLHNRRHSLGCRLRAP